MTRRILLLGATGLVGHHCLHLLQKHPSAPQITVLARQSAPAQFPTQSTWMRTNFTNLSALHEIFAIDAVICALGTTRKQAGSRAAFVEVDLRIPLACAALARQGGATHCGVVSAMGANPNSPWLYNRTKGELESGLGLLGFPSLCIARPSLLLGNREVLGQPQRRGEALAQRFTTPVLQWIPAFWRPVEAEQVARAIVSAAMTPEPGTRILYNRKLGTL